VILPSAEGGVALGTAPASDAAMEALTRAFETEAHLLRQLGEILRGQRDGIARDDLQAVDDSVFSAHRVVLTLGEARRRRRSLLRVIVGEEDVPLGELGQTLGNRMNDQLRCAAQELQGMATRLSRDIAVNRQVLREALRSGDDRMRALMGQPAGQLLYGREAEAADEPRRSGVLINRQV
jgi:hypothetical protein